MKFPDFSRPSKQSFFYKVKTRCNESPKQSFRYSSWKITEYIFRGMVTGSTVAMQTYMSVCCVSDCVAKKNSIWYTRIPWVYFTFPEFSINNNFTEISMFFRVVSTLYLLPLVRKSCNSPRMCCAICWNNRFIHSIAKSMFLEKENTRSRPSLLSVSPSLCKISSGSVLDCWSYSQKKNWFSIITIYNWIELLLWDYGDVLCQVLYNISVNYYQINFINFITALMDHQNGWLVFKVPLNTL